MLNNCPKPYLTVVKTEQKTTIMLAPCGSPSPDLTTLVTRLPARSDAPTPIWANWDISGCGSHPAKKKKIRKKKKQSHPDAKSLHMASQITGRGVPARNRDRHAKLTSGPENWDQPATKPLRATHRLGSTSRPLHTAGERRTFPQQPLRDPAPPVPAFKLRPSLLHRDAKCFQPCAVGGNRHFFGRFPCSNFVNCNSNWPINWWPFG